MGLLDFILGYKRDAEQDTQPVHSEPSPAKSSWVQQRERATSNDDFDWEWGNTAAHALAHAALKLAQPHFGGAAAKIKEVPDDENIDLRGTYEGTPIRFAVWMSFGSFWTIEMRAPVWAGMFMLERDHEKVPKHGDANDPWEEDETLRIFLAKGIYVEGGEVEVQQRLGRWAQLDEEAREFVLAQMEALDGHHLMYAGKSVSFNQAPGLGDLDEPVPYMQACAKLLHVLLTAFNNAGIAEQGPSVPTLAASARVTCGYCTTLFFSSPGHTNCPNCGAPPKA